MAHDIQYVKATMEHIHCVGETMREMDIREISVMGERDPTKVLYDSCRRSDYCRAVIIDDVCCAIFGLRITGVLTGDGVPWMLASEKLMSHARLILSESPKQLVNMAVRCGCADLYNYVHSENKRVIRWLKWMGFNVEDPIPFGFKGDHLCRFTMRIS